MILLRDGGPLAQIGGKAHGLTRLHRAGLPVPDGWVLPAEALEWQVTALGLSEAARQVEEGLSGGDWPAPACQIRGALLRAELPGGIRAEVRGMSGKLAVRSSATCESLAGASFAGQFQTFLDVEDLEQASAAIRSCWASLWSAPALRYRAARPTEAAPGMAVLLQRFVAGSVSGTILVHDRGVDVEATWGLGPSIMSGLVVPDRYRFDTIGRPVARTVGRKTVGVSATGGNLSWRALGRDEQAGLSLTETQATLVAELGLRATEVTGGPVELEWVLEGQQVWLVQARRTDGQPRTADASLLTPGGVAGLQGIPAAPGRAVGCIRIVHHAEDLAAVGPDDIVVTRYASPAMAHAFRGAGWITEMGGASGHGVTLARERQLPMVTGVLRATARLTEGQLVRLDGGRGVVELGSKDAPES